MATQSEDYTTDPVSNSPSQVTDIPESHQILYAYIVLMAVMSIIGVMGNTLVIVVLLTSKKLRVLQNAFIANLALADLLVTSLVNPFAIVGAIDMGDLFYRLPAFCEFLATICVTSFVCSIWRISSVSLNRYFYICHRALYTKIYNKYTVPLMVLGIWCIAFLIDLPNFLGWGDHIFDTRNYLCNYNYSHNFSYTRGFLLPLGFILPLSILCFSYVRIYLTARRSERQLRKYDTSQLTNQRRYKLKSSDKRLLKTVAIICTMFVVMWSPYAIAVIFDLGDHFWFFLVGSFMAFTNSSVNFLIYATDMNFRQAYLEIRDQMLRCCGCSQKASPAKVTNPRRVDVNIEINDASSTPSARDEASST